MNAAPANDAIADIGSTSTSFLRIRADGTLQQTGYSGTSITNANFSAVFNATPTPLRLITPPDWRILVSNDAHFRVGKSSIQGRRT